MSSNFEKVKEFNRAFGLDVPQKYRTAFLEDDALVKLRYSLIHEEVQELKQALKEKDIVEVADALADILYVVYGAGVAFGIDMDRAFDLVHKSNMSKLCDSLDEAQETVEWYKKKFQDNLLPYDSPAFRYDQNTDKYVVYNQSTGKIHKNKYYQPVDLEPLFK